MVVNGLEIPYRVFAIPVMPGERVRLRSPERPAAALAITAAAGVLSPAGTDRWSWEAPRTPGLHVVRIVETASGEAMTLNVLVLTTRSRKVDGRIEGYRIGHYPRDPYRGLEAYTPPPGFIRVDRELAALPVSPHFTLGQFLAKQRSGWPKFVLVSPEALLVLERLLEVVNERGIRTDGFAVLSGYRTPFYNRAIGNGRHSRHQWGDAMDIYVDEGPPHGRMDDLDGDGRSTVEDARYLAALAREVLAELDVEGGLGIYGPASHRGAFVHVDVRGFRARWEF